MYKKHLFDISDVRRDTTVFLSPQKFRTNINCMYCGNILTSDNVDIKEVYENMKTDSGMNVDPFIKNTSFPMTIRCRNKRCKSYWHFHKV